MRFDRCFVTGCDKRTEWQLKWFLQNYHASGNTVPIVFCDFGVSPEVLKWAENNFDEVVYHGEFKRDAKRFIGHRMWFLKPLAMSCVNSNKKFWLDTDCEVLGNISGIFNHLSEGKISIAVDRPWTRRRGEVWHNSGVFGVVGSPDILYQWVMQCQKSSLLHSHEGIPIGDQDALHSLIGPDGMKHVIHIHTLPNIYNWLRIQLLDNEDSPDKLIMHWTGPRGSDIIQQKIRHG